MESQAHLSSEIKLSVGQDIETTQKVNNKKYITFSFKRKQQKTNVTRDLTGPSLNMGKDVYDVERSVETERSPFEMEERSFT